MSDVLENIRMRRAEARAKLFPPPDPTIVVRPWTAAEYYAAGHGRGRGGFNFNPPIDTRLPSERLGYRY